MRAGFKTRFIWQVALVAHPTVLWKHQRASCAAGRRGRKVRTSARLGATVGLKQLAKLFDGKPGVADDTAEGKCVDGVVTRDGEDARRQT